MTFYLLSPPDTEHKRKQNDLNKCPEPRILSNKSQINQTVQNIPVSSQGAEKGSLDPDENIRQRLEQLKQGKGELNIIVVKK